MELFDGNIGSCRDRYNRMKKCQILQHLLECDDSIAISIAVLCCTSKSWVFGIKEAAVKTHTKLAFNFPKT